MTSINSDAAHSGERPRRLSATDVQRVGFAKASRGRRGYDEREVDVFLHEVEVELARLVTERDGLREESAQLRRQLDDAQAGAGDAEQRKQEAHQQQAVGLLAKAQQTADQYVAEAEAYSRTLSQDARQRYEDTLAEARARASAILEGATSAVGGRHDQEKDRTALEQEVAYLQTFGKACRIQLRSFLETLIRQIEQEWGQADPAAAAQHTADGPADNKDVPGTPAKPQPAQLRVGSNGRGDTSVE